MADVLLAHSNHLFHDRKQVEKMQPYPPLQTILAAAVLRDVGCDVAFHDVTFESSDAAFLECLLASKPGMLVICEDSFNFLSKMCLGRNREVSCRMARMAKSLGVATAVYSPDAIDNSSHYLAAGFDYVIAGEIETTLLELVRGGELDRVAGLVYRDAANGQVRSTPQRKLSADLDRLPMPAWDLVDINRYRQAWLERHCFFSLNLISSRGCPFACNWCAKPAYGNSYRVLKPDAIAGQMLYLKQHYQPDHIWFADDIFALSNQWTLDFAASVEALSVRIPFKMQSRCDLMTRSTVDALRRAGCVEVWMGAESGSQQILSAMDKGQKVEAVYEARRNLKRHGIRACFFLQFGYPGEQWNEIEETIRMVRETKPDDIGVSVSYPLPQTKFFNLVSAQLGSKRRWSESGDLAMMFRGAFSSEFYRALADALHTEVRNPDAETTLEAAWNRVFDLRDGESLATEVSV